MNITDSSTNAVSTATQGGAAVLCVTFLHNTLMGMIPYLIAAGVLILVDLNFGVRAAIRKREEVRFSRMVRRTLGKAFEYLCWVTLSASLSVAFEFRGLQYIILGVVAANELVSILSNWAFLHGKKIQGINWMKIFGEKAGIDISDVKIKEDKMKISEKGLSLIKRFEGLRLEAYKCPAGIDTIGYGHTSGVYPGMKITEEAADKYLVADCHRGEDAVHGRIQAYLKQEQFDALVAFTMNVGASAFKSSTLASMVNEDPDNPAIRKEFLRWNKATVNGKKKVLPGLTRRREAEAELYFS